MASIYDIHIHPDPPTLWESSQPFARLLWSQLNTEGQGGEEREIGVGWGGGGGSSNLHWICQEMAAEDGRSEGGEQNANSSHAGPTARKAGLLPRGARLSLVAPGPLPWGPKAPGACQPHLDLCRLKG